MDKNTSIQRLCAVANVSEEEARHMLEAFDWDLDEAIQAYFGSETGVPSPQNRNVMNSGTQSTSGLGAAMPSCRVVTLDSIKQSVDNSDDRQAFYVGGADTGGGGQQVIGPPKNPKKIPDPEHAPDEFIHDLFQSARVQGAEVLETERYKSDLDTRKKIMPFSGTGYTLGEDLHGPTVAHPSAQTNVPSHKTDSKERHVIVKLWRDGFSLDDGNLRSYTDPGSQSFLDDIKAGRVPQEVVSSAAGGSVNVLLEDHHHETWSAPPPPKVVPFSGKGNMLGHPVPNLSAVAPIKETGEPGPAVNENEPITQLQVRLPDGSRLPLRLNHSHTIGDLRLAILSERPSLAFCPFVLMATFPNRELSDETQTLVGADLLQSSLVVRLT